MTIGWLCARCGRSNAPFVARPCSAATAPSVPQWPSPQGPPQFPSGQTCARCGTWYVGGHICWLGTQRGPIAIS